MSERITSLTDRDKAQKIFEKSGRGGFVEDFMETRCDDLRFMGMEEKDQNLWIKIAEKFPSLIDQPPLFD